MVARIPYIAAALAVLAVILWWWQGAGETERVAAPALSAELLWEDVPPGQIPPESNYLPIWADILGGDEPLDTESVAALNSGEASKFDGDIAAVRAAATAAAQRRVGDPAALEQYNAGDPYPDDEPDDDWAGRCTNVAVDAVAVMELPAPEHIGGQWAKAAALYRGNCPDGNPDGALRVTYVYLHGENERWAQVRPTTVPWSGNTGAWGADGSVNPSDLVTLEQCVADDITAKLAPEAAATWEVMCDAAEADGVTLEVISAHRGPEEQAERVDSAASRFSDTETARRWVASVDSAGCASRHCAGAAVDVSEAAGWDWVNETVGCLGANGVPTDVPDTGCGAGAAVTRGSTYGWVAPLRNQPWHLEYSWPITSIRGAVTCSPAPSTAVPETIAAVWRCRLGAAGYPAETARQVAAEAVQVSRCVSGWNPAAVEAGGRWQETPDPATGQTRDGAGIFLLRSGDAERFAPGGAEGRSDSRANAAGAAAAWIAEHVDGGDGWSRWPCADSVAPSAGATSELTGDAYLW